MVFKMRASAILASYLVFLGFTHVKSLSRVQLLVTPWTAAYQAPPSMGFSRQEYWSGLPFPSPGALPDPGIEPKSPTLQADALSSEPPEKPVISWLRRVNLLEHWIYQLSKGEIKLRVLLYFLSIYAITFMYCFWPAFLFLLTMSLSLFFLAMLCGIQDLSSPTRDQTCAPSSGSFIGPLGSSQQIML